jgi:hypothetical protein
LSIFRVNSGIFGVIFGHQMRERKVAYFNRKFFVGWVGKLSGGKKGFEFFGESGNISGLTFPDY